MDPSHQIAPFSQQQQQQRPFDQAPPMDAATTAAPPAVDSSPAQTPAGFVPNHQPQPFQSAQHQQQIQAFWANQMQEIQEMTDFRNHTLPLARIKKIMKADEDVRMISSETPIVFAKACEMFILELTLRSWIHTEENKRRTLQKNDIAAAISRTDVFDFLVDIIPRDELKEEGLRITNAGIPLVGSPPDALPYYFVPQQAPAIPAAAALYTPPQPQPSLPFMPWPRTQAQQPTPPGHRQSSDSKE